MSNPEKIKPLVATGKVLEVLLNFFDRPIQNLEVLQGGNVAQAFSFSVDSGNMPGAGEMQEYITRFNPPMPVNFEMEAYAYTKFASASIPIPRVIQLGLLEGISFAITEKMPGQTLLQIPRPDYLALVPRLITVLEAIHQIHVADKPGYGVFDGNGNAPESSWQEHLELVGAEDPADGFFGRWHTLYQDSFLEQDLFESINRKMMELSKYTPEERALVHGDYGFGNVLAQAGKITAILDWMGARYGDFLYDVAWLDFWAPQDRWIERFQQHYHHAGRAVPFYQERILCCQCYITLNAMKFYAKAGSQEGYGFVKERINTRFQNE